MFQFNARNLIPSVSIVNEDCQHKVLDNQNSLFHLLNQTGYIFSEHSERERQKHPSCL